MNLVIGPLKTLVAKQTDKQQSKPNVDHRDHRWGRAIPSFLYDFIEFLRKDRSTNIAVTLANWAAWVFLGEITTIVKVLSYIEL